MTSRQRWTLGVVALATFMMLLDVTVVTVALPSIYADFKTDLSGLQWVVDAYLLMMAALILPAGSVADSLGHKRLWVAGMVVFLLSSAGCGLSVDIEMLNLMRAVQGLGAVLLLATALPLLAHAFPPEKRTMALGIWGAAMGSAVATGPLVGGMLTQWLSWRWIFLINIPLGIVALVACAARVSESRDEGTAPVDRIGVATLTPALFLLVFALIRGNEDGWGSGWVVTAAVGGALFLTGFAARQVTARNPMLPLRLLKDRGFLATSIVSFLLGVSLLGIFAYLALYLQGTLAYGPLATGLRFLPVTLVAVVFSPPSARLSDRVATRYLLAVAMTLIGVGVMLMAFEAGHGWRALLPGFVVAGAGLGATAPLLASVTLQTADEREAGVTSGMVLGARQLGNSVGVAVFGVLYEMRITDRLEASLRGGPLGDPAAVHLLSKVVAAGGAQQAGDALPANLRATFRPAAEQAATSGLKLVLVVAAVVAFLGTVGALFMRTPAFAAVGAPGTETPGTPPVVPDAPGASGLPRGVDAPEPTGAGPSPARAESG